MDNLGSTYWLRYQYDAAGRLAQVADDSNNPRERYLYGADRHRAATLSGSSSDAQTYYVWEGDHKIAEYTHPNATLAWSKSTSYLGDRVLATFLAARSGETVHYHHPDRIGTRLITNEIDSSATEQITLPFGTLIPTGSTDPINPIFTTYDRSSVTGLDYAINRQYDSMETFTQVDPAETLAIQFPIPQTFNMYSYVGNDPVNRTDPPGLGTTEDVIKGTIAIAQGIGNLLAGNYINACCNFANGIVTIGGTDALANAAIGTMLPMPAVFVALTPVAASQMVGLQQAIATVLANSPGGYFANYTSSVTVDNITANSVTGTINDMSSGEQLGTMAVTSYSISNDDGTTSTGVIGITIFNDGSSVTTNSFTGQITYTAPNGDQTVLFSTDVGTGGGGTCPKGCEKQE